ncbi:MAG TPA: hypothetical protein VI146_01410 [Nitrososphaeraceae archaeon]
MIAPSEKPSLDNSTYNILVTLGIEANFIHSTVDRYITDAQMENRPKLFEVWNTIKQDKEKHLEMLKDCLDTEVKEGKLNQ